MKMFGFLTHWFNFGKKYRDKEQKYYNNSKKFGTSGMLIENLLISSIPLLALWGSFKAGGDLFPLKILCIMLCFSIFIIPGELMVNGIVAIRHAVKKKAENVIASQVMSKTAEMISGEETKIEHKTKGTAYAYDIVVGILAIVLSIAVVVGFIVMFFGFLSHL